MEKKAGFKECPRCGLRNKPSAAQCDFCGWEFRDVSDEWISHVQVLEKLNKATESIVLDDEVSRRIESTIVRSSREVPPAPSAPDATVATPTAPHDVAIAEPESIAKTDKWPERRVVTVPPPIPEEEREVKNFVETMIGEPVSAQAAAEVNLRASDIVSLPLSPANPLHEEVVEVYAPSGGFVSRYWKPLLGVGVALYLLTLVMFWLSYLDVMMAWVLVIVGSALITLGVSHLYDSRIESKAPSEPVIGELRHAGDEVIICPRCHEEVGEGDARCPSCGAAFTR